MKRTAEELEQIKNRQILATTPVASGNYLHKRGKVTAAPQASWGMKGGDGQDLHSDGLRELGEALGD